MVESWRVLAKTPRDGATVLVDPRGFFTSTREEARRWQPAVLALLMVALAVGIAAVRLPDGAPDQAWTRLAWLGGVSPLLAAAGVGMGAAVILGAARWLGGNGTLPDALRVSAYASVAVPVWAATHGSFFLGSLSVILWVYIVACGMEVMLGVKRQVVWNLVVALVAVIFVGSAVAGFLEGP